MELKDLVPPLELCKQIPDGKFKDSALIWSYDDDFWSIQDRNAVMPYIPEDTHPAPTLAEIMEELRNNGVMLCGESDGTWTAIRWVKLERYAANDANPATAALKLWLEVNKPDTPDRTDRKEEETEKTEETDEKRGTEN